MINAFLVFNGQGQPRLTKFYTQLVSSRDYGAMRWTAQPAASSSNLVVIGNQHPATTNFRNIHAGIESTVRILQLPPPAAVAGCLKHHQKLVRGTERCPVAGDVPQLRDSLLYRHLHIDGVATRTDRSDTSIRGGAGQAFRECLRARSNLQLRDATRDAVRDDCGRRGNRDKPGKNSCWSQSAGYCCETACQRGTQFGIGLGVGHDRKLWLGRAVRSGHQALRWTC